MEQISFSAFKKATHHKPVVFVATKANGEIRTFENKKFYINKDYKSKMYWMPGYGLGDDNIFYKIDDNSFKSNSELSETEFTIREEED